MAEKREFDKRERRPRKRPAKLLEGDTKLNYKNVELLTNFITERKKIAPRRMTGCTAIQQRRVATARTLAQKPSLIMADEFLSELDEETMTMVLNEVTKYIRQSGASLLVVEHDISRARSMADRLLVIDDGRVNPFITEATAIEVKI